MQGTRVIHLDEEKDIESYKECWSRMAKHFVIENGENIRWQGVSNSETFTKECKDNNLKAVVVDINACGEQGILDVVSTLKTEGIITCPIFFISESRYEQLCDDTKESMNKMRAQYIQKTANPQVVKEQIQEMLK